MGFSDFRVRKRGDTGLIQVPECQMVSVIRLREEIALGIRPYFEKIALDLEGRKAHD